MPIIFDMPNEESSIIKVIGVGGGGGNAVNYMFKQGITGVNFVVCNTDEQALEMSNVPNKIQLGPDLTSGRGAGAHPEVGKNATLESLDEVKKILATNTKMAFVTAGMGGGTGTGGAPVVAQVAREMGILTVGIVTLPFDFEGKRKREKALAGLEEMKSNVDAMIVISNNKLREVYGNLALHEAFSNADSILATAAKGIAEIITKPGFINVDFEDVKTVMENSGVALMGIGEASGENRATKAVQDALASPLLNNDNIHGAKGVLLNISGPKDMTMDEITEITEYMEGVVAADAEIIWGVCYDDNETEILKVTLIATGFEDVNPIVEQVKTDNKVVHSLEDQQLKSNEEDVSNVNKKDDINAASEEQVIFQLNELNDRYNDEISEITEEHDNMNNFVNEEIEEQIPSLQFEVRTIDTTDEVAEERVEETLEDAKNQALKRLSKLKNSISISRMRSSSSIKDLEDEPAYVRQNVKIEDREYSSEETLSNLSLDNSYNKEIEDSFEIKENGFLHDNVD